MLKFYLTNIFLLVFFTSFSQILSVTYYDSEWKLTTKNEADFYRVGIIDTVEYKFHGEVKDFYINGQLEMKGRYYANIKTDTFYFYYPNGQLKTKGLYLNNKRYGVWFNYYENGQLREKLTFNGKFLAALDYYDEEGIQELVNGNGKWKTEFQLEGTNFYITVKGSYKDTVRNGNWTYHRRSKSELNKGAEFENRLECTEYYNNGKFIKGKQYNLHGSGYRNLESSFYNIHSERPKFHLIEKWVTVRNLTIESYPHLKFLPSLVSEKVKDSEGNWLVHPEVPAFPGGLNKFHEYVKDNFNCNSIARGVNEKLSVRFEVDATGYIKKGSVIVYNTNMSEICIDRMIETIEKSPKWNPGYIAVTKECVPVVLSINDFLF